LICANVPCEKKINPSTDGKIARSAKVSIVCAVTVDTASTRRASANASTDVTENGAWTLSASVKSSHAPRARCAP
jgi:hypothetical protein